MNMLAGLFAFIKSLHVLMPKVYDRILLVVINHCRRTDFRFPIKMPENGKFKSQGLLKCIIRTTWQSSQTRRIFKVIFINMLG